MLRANPHARRVIDTLMYGDMQLFAVLVILAGTIPDLLTGGRGIIAVAGIASTIHLPKLLEAMVALGIETEAQFNGLRSKGHYWKAHWLRLVGLLTAALALRGFEIWFLMSRYGTDHPHLVATGLVATDPAAFAIVGKMFRVVQLDWLVWLLTIESLLNDFIGLVLFRAAEGEREAVLRSLVATIILSVGLAMAEVGNRWLIRNGLFKNGVLQLDIDSPSKIERFIAKIIPQNEAKTEVIGIFLVYSMFIGAGILANASLIGMTALAAILGDLFVDLLPVERERRRKVEEAATNGHHHPAVTIEHQRREYHEVWSRIGLGAVLFTVSALIPYHAIFTNKEVLIGGFLILVAIFVSRLMYEAVVAIYLIRSGREKTADKPALVSLLAAQTILGVPSVVAFEMYLDGHRESAETILAAIVMSWFWVFVTVPTIQKVEQSLERLLQPHRRSQAKTQPAS